MTANVKTKKIRFSSLRSIYKSRNLIGLFDEYIRTLEKVTSGNERKTKNLYTGNIVCCSNIFLTG
jgi:hypothetical protein